MTSIYVRLFSTPLVKKDGEPVVFPFRKAEALFYYLLVNKQATRDELVHILWGEVGEETAKKNLRHAMYKIRKTFDMDIIISPQKSVVMLNPDISIETDLHIFLCDENNGIDAYTGEFLQGFYVKDGEAFEEWMWQYREHLRSLYVKRLHEKIEESFQHHDFPSVEQYGKLLIGEDPFNERIYRTLMKIYGNIGAYTKALDLYHRLTATLEEELGVGPDAETQKLMEEILTLRDMKSGAGRQGNDTFFYGRQAELQRMTYHYANFLSGNKAKSLLIIGEAGIGKTRLKDIFLQKVSERDVYLLTSNCYQAEEAYHLKPWNDIFAKLADILEKEKIEIPLLWKNVISYIFPIFGADSTLAHINPVEQLDSLKYQVAEQAIMGVLKKVCGQKKILLIFEDLHWMDKMSLSLLTNILLRQPSSDIMVLATCRNGYEERIDKFIASVVKYDVLEIIDLQRFSMEEVEEFTKQALPDFQWTKALHQKIYEETEGNTFFLVEMVNAVKEKGNMEEMSSKMQDILKSRFFDISEEGKRLLNIASLFFDKVSLEFLKMLSGKDEMEIIDAMEELQRRCILKETGDTDQISYMFTHQKLREFIYMQQSSGRRKILHNKIGRILENALHNDHRDRLIYSKLIYHFRSAGNQLATLKYLIKNLDAYFDFSHEMFPTLSDKNMEDERNSYLSHGEAMKQLNEIEALIQEMHGKVKESTEFRSLEMAFLHMKGRYLIREGQYEEGIANIQQMIQTALEMEDYEFALKGYRQMAYYGIQIHDIELMKEYVENGLHLATTHHLQKEIGILLRLKGLNKIMSGAYEEAEEILKQSIGIFQAISQHEDKYSLNIAAGYNYIGEIRRYNMKFNSALAYYDKAMAICQEKKILRGLTIFNTNAGQAALDMGDYLRAKNYFQKALHLYNQLDGVWGRSTAEGYMALLMTKDGEYENALEHLKRADQYAEKLQSPYEQGLVYRVKAEIKANMKKNKRLHHTFSNYLHMDLETYCDKGITLLKKLKESYEVEILEVLRRNSG